MRTRRSPSARGSCAVRRTAFFTVRTTSSGCSSPNRHSRELPVSSPAEPASATSWSPRPVASSLANTRRSAVAPEPADRLGGELELAVGAVEVALPLQLALQLAQRGEVVDRRAAQRALEQFLVDVGQRGAGVALGQLAGQRLEVGELGDGAGRVAHAEALLAVGHLPALAPRQVGAGLAEGVLQVGHLAGQPHVGHGLGHQVRQLGALVGREPGHHPFLRGRPAGEGVDELLDRLAGCRGRTGRACP